MTRRRWVQLNGQLVEVDPNSYEPVRRDDVLWNDRAYQDAKDPRFKSRAQHREYMRVNGLTTADDFKDTWSRAQKEREALFTTGGDHRARREDVLRAFHKRMR